MAQPRNVPVSGRERSRSGRVQLILATVGAAVAATCVAVPSAYAVITVPGAPTRVQVAPGNAWVAVKWSAPTSSGGSAITGYTAKATLVGSSSAKYCTTKGATTCSVNNLLNGSVYNITVRASNVKGTGPASAPITVTPGVPGQPTHVAVARGNASVLVSWTAPANNGSAINRYTVTSSPGARTCTTFGATHCTVKGLTNGTPYTFKVTATNARGTGVASAPSASVTPAPALTIAVGENPWGISSDGLHVWVANSSSDTVTELNSSDGSIVQIRDGGSDPRGISSDGDHVWVVNDGVAELNALDGSLIQNIQTSGGLGVSSDGTHVWVANQVSGVIELNASDGSLVQNINVGFLHTNYVSSDGTHVWVTSDTDNTVTELNASDGSLVRTISVNVPQGVASDGTHVWVASWNYHTVTELNASDGALVRTIPVGYGPEGVSSDGTHVWVTNYLDNTVTEINASNGLVVQTIIVGNSPQAVSSDGTHVWVTNYLSNTVTEFAA